MIAVQGRAIPYQQFQRLLIEIRGLPSAGLTFEIDVGHDTFSVWTPDPGRLCPRQQTELIHHR